MAEKVVEIVYNADTSDYVQSLGAAATSTTEFNDTLKNQAQGMSVFSKALAIVTPTKGFIAGMTGATMAASQFQKQLASLNATSKVLSKGDYQVSFDKLAKSVKDMSRVFGSSVAENKAVIQSFQEIGFTGKKTESALESMSRTTIKMSRVVGESSTTIGPALGQLSKAYGNFDPTQFSKMADTLTYVSKASGASASGILEFSKSITPFAKQVGVGEKAVMGISAAFTTLGEDGFVAMNAANKIFSDINRSIQDGSDDIFKYSNLVGVTADNFRAMVKSDPSGTLVRIFQAIQNAPAPTRELERLGLEGARSLRAITAVTQAGTLQTSINQALSGQAAGAVGRGYEAFQHTLDQQSARLHESAKQIVGAVGTPALAAVTPVVQAGANIAGTVAGVIQTPVVQKAITVVSAALAGATVLRTVNTAAPWLRVLTSGPPRAIAAGLALGAGATRDPTTGRIIPAPLAGRTGFGVREAERLAKHEADDTIKPYNAWFRDKMMEFRYNMDQTLGVMAGASGTAPRGPGFLTRAARQATFWGTTMASVGTATFSREPMENALRDPELRKNVLFFRGRDLDTSKIQNENVRKLAEDINKTRADVRAGSITHAAGAKNIVTAFMAANQAAGADPQFKAGVRTVTDELKRTATAAGGLTGRLTGVAAKGVATGGAALASLGLTNPITLGLMGLTAGVAVKGYMDTKASEREASRSGTLTGLRAWNEALGMATPELHGIAVSSEDASNKLKELAVGAGNTSDVLNNLPQIQSLTATGQMQPTFKLVKGSTASMAQQISTQAIGGQITPAQLTMAASSLFASGLNTTQVGDILTKASALAQSPQTGKQLVSPGVEAVRTGSWWNTFVGNTENKFKDAIDTATDSLATSISAAGEVGGEAAKLQAFNKQGLEMTTAVFQGTKGSGKQNQYTLDTLRSVMGVSGVQQSIYEAALNAPAAAPAIGKALASGKQFGSMAEMYRTAAGMAGEDTTKKKLLALADALDDATKSAQGTVAPFEDVAKAFQKGEPQISSFITTVGKGGEKGSALQTFLTSETGSEYAKTMAGGQLYQEAGGGTALEKLMNITAGMLAQPGTTGDRWKALQAAQGIGQRQLAWEQLGQTPTQQFAGQAALSLSGLQSAYKIIQTGQKPDTDQMQMIQGMADQLQSAMTQNVQFHAQQMQAEHEYQLNRSRMEQDYQIGRKRAEEDYQLSLKRNAEDFATSRKRYEEDYQISRLHAEEQFRISMERAERDFAITRARQLRDAVSSIIDPLKRVGPTPTWTGAGLDINLQRQNERMQQQLNDLGKLRNMGLTQAAVDALKLTAPENALQAKQLVNDLMTDPRLVAKLNKQVLSRTGLTKGLMEEQPAWKDQLADFQKSTKDAVADQVRNAQWAEDEFQKGLDRMVADYGKGVKRMAEDHGKGMQRMADDFNKELARTEENFNEAMRAMNGYWVKLAKQTYGNLDALTKEMDPAIRKQITALIDWMGTQGDDFVTYLGGLGVAGLAGIGAAYAAATGGDDGGKETAPRGSTNYTGGGFIGPGGFQVKKTDVRGATETTTTFGGTNQSWTTVGTQSDLRAEIPYGTGKLKGMTAAQQDRLYGPDEPFKSGLVSPNTKQASEFVSAVWGISPTGLGTKSGHAANSDHHYGKAMDIPTRDLLTGNEIARWFVANPFVFGTKQVIWRHGIDTAGDSRGWHRWSADDHMSHVHVSLFETGGLINRPTLGVVGEKGPEAILPLNKSGLEFMLSLMNRYATQSEVRMLTTNQRRAEITSNQNVSSMSYDQHTEFSGPISVVANDPDEMARSLVSRQRRQALTRQSASRR